MRTCEKLDCNKPHLARGLCNAHYIKARTAGVLMPLRKLSEEERFWSRVVRGENCWTWTGTHSAAGYGTFVRDGRRQCYAHRYSYELHCGPIPADLQIDHLCRNRGCLNPAHLEAVTQQENIRRGERANRTHCPRDHPYDDGNTRRTSRGRWCRTCAHEAAVARAQERKRQRYRDGVQKLTGHGPVMRALGDWRCRCGQVLGDTKRQAQAAMPDHRRLVLILVTEAKETGWVAS